MPPAASRRRLLRGAALALLFSLPLTWVNGHAQAQEPTRPPNIVILFADDLGYGDLGRYGHPAIRTPNLDALADEGQRWTDFYVAAPVCSPSRGALLTGRLPNNTGLYGRRLGVLFPGDTVGIPESETTLAEALRGRGYATGIFGKWHLGDAPETYPTRHGFDEWLGIPYSNDMEWVGDPSFQQDLEQSIAGNPPDYAARQTERFEKYFNPQMAYWNVPLVSSTRSPGGFEDDIVERPAQQASLTRRYTQSAVDFMTRHRDQPFLLYVPYTMPHTPLFPGEAFAGQSRAGRYGDVIEEIDWSVGRIVAALRELSLDDDTLVVFSSDNGPWLWMRNHGGSAGPLRDGKGTTWEGGMRVPGIFWWPGRIKTAVISDIGSTLDLFATVAALAGIDAPPGDGIDLSPTLLSGTPSPRTEFPYYRAGDLRAYRHGRYKLHVVIEGAYGNPPNKTTLDQPLLYDLAADPGERNDIANISPDIVATIQRAITAHQATVNTRAPLFDQRLDLTRQRLQVSE